MLYFLFSSLQERKSGAHSSKLPAELSNRRLETGATRLFGDDPRRSLFLKSVAHQQGLLQIYEDFCFQDNSDCAQCRSPNRSKMEIVKKSRSIWKSKSKTHAKAGASNSLAKMVYAFRASRCHHDHRNFDGTLFPAFRGVQDQAKKTRRKMMTQSSPLLTRFIRSTEIIRSASFDAQSQLPGRTLFNDQVCLRDLAFDRN